MMGKVAFVVKGLSLNLSNDVLRGSARIFDLCNRNTSQKTRDYIVISFNTYMGRAAAYNRLRLIKGFRAYLAAKTYLVKAYEQGFFLIRPVIDSTCSFAVGVCNVPASRTSWLSVLFDSVYQPGQPSSAASVCSTTIRGYRSLMHRLDSAHRVETLSSMRLHSGFANRAWCTDKTARSYTRKPIPIGAFPEYSTLTRLPGNSGCHKGCWGSGSFSSPRLLQVRLAIPCSLSSNNVPTCMLHKDRGACVPIELKLISGRKPGHAKITRERVVA